MSTVSSVNASCVPVHLGTRSTFLDRARCEAVAISLAAGVVVFGWRAGVLILLLVVGWELARRVWWWIEHEGISPRPAFQPLPALLLAAMLPAELAGGRSGDWSLWPVVIAAPMLLAMATVLKRHLSLRFEPAILTILVIQLAIGSSAVARSALQRSNVVVGDLMVSQSPPASTLAWYEVENFKEVQATLTTPGVAQLDAYLRSTPASESWSTIDGLLRERMPPLEDLVLLGHPMPVGQGSAALLIAGALWLAFRGVIRVRVPLLVLLGAYVSMTILLVPTAIDSGRATWTWLAPFSPGVGVDVGLSFVHYLLLASPIVFVATMLATSAAIQPLHPRAAGWWAVLTGVVVGACTIYLSVATGAYVALLVCGIIGVWFDRWFAPKPLRV
jgi:NQR2, RnfD, RnfE family